MGLLDQNKVESSSSCKNNGKIKKIFKGRMKGVENKYHELKTLCGLRVFLYVDSEFNKDKNGHGSVRILPENPIECQEIIKDFINYDPKTAGKRKRDTDEEFVDSECMKMRKLCNGDVKEEKFIDQNQLSNLSIEEIQRIERNLEPMFGMISERIDQLMMEKNTSTSDPSAEGCNGYETIMMKESPRLPLDPEFDYPYSSDPKNESGMISERIDKSNDPSTKGCNEDDVITMKESPSLPLEPKFDYPSSSDSKNEFGMISERIDKSNDPSRKGCNEDDVIMMKEFPPLPEFDNQSSPSKDFYNYNCASENQFDYDVNQWLNLPGVPGLTNDDIVFEPFPDLEFKGLNNFAGSFTDMINCY